MTEILAKSRNDPERRLKMGMVLGGIVAVLLMWSGLLVWGVLWLAS